jgi:hypothetical protein
MKSIDNLKNLHKPQYSVAYVEVNSFIEGRDAAIKYFKSIFEGEDWDDNRVHIKEGGSKLFKTKKKGVQTIVYEAFFDSGGVNFFFFGFECENVILNK